jgi:hypothetical protein
LEFLLFISFFKLKFQEVIIFIFIFYTNLFCFGIQLFRINMKWSIFVVIQCSNTIANLFNQPLEYTIYSKWQVSFRGVFSSKTCSRYLSALISIIWHKIVSDFASISSPKPSPEWKKQNVVEIYNMNKMGNDNRSKGS